MAREPASSLLVLLVVGLTEQLLAHAPRMAALAEAGALRHLTPPLPAVTCTSQSTLLTGTLPREHGVVANGWYFRDLAEVWLWRQSNRLVQGAKLWEVARERAPGLRTAQLFWWFNMYATVDLSVTPRPHYPSDGRKIPGIYTEPSALERELEDALGPFPLFQFWGPGAGLASSRWIQRATSHVLRKHTPGLTLAYLPHLDYDLQRHGPDFEGVAEQVAAVDGLAGELIDQARAVGTNVSIVSEYGIEAVSRPVHLNRALRKAGLLRVRSSVHCGETLDCGASRAFAVADHQLAHVYVRDPGADLKRVRTLLEAVEGVERVLGEAEKREAGLDHARSGELVCLAERGAFFTYYYWLDEALAPDFASSVDIHRKPGYDPAELFLVPGAGTKLKIAARLAQKKLGFRYRMDVVPTDASLVRGSHGRLPSSPAEGPVLIVSDPDAMRPGPALPMTEVRDIWLGMLEP
ncbi:MAG: alkaline phosphatase family protein [Planctomycetota bacterium]